MTDTKFTAALGAIGALAAPAAGADDVLGIPLGVLLASCAGALFGLAYTPPEQWGRLLAIPNGSRLKRYSWVALRAGGLLFTLAAIAFVCAWLAIGIPHVPGMSWAVGIGPKPMAGILAFAGQHFVPRLLNAGARGIDSIRGKKP
jgi:hypothetical protein